MSRKSRGSRKDDRPESTLASGEQATLKRKDYDQEMERLHGELVAAAAVGQSTRASKVCIVFEGRDGAGKGGTIKAITERVESARLPRRRAAGADAIARSRRCTCSATCRTCRRQARS